MELPKEPPPGLLVSMALRFDHGLGCGGYYDALYGDGEHDKRMASTLGIMRQLYEEVSGQGFYSPEREDHYAKMAPNSKGEQPAANELNKGNNNG